MQRSLESAQSGHALSPFVPEPPAWVDDWLGPTVSRVVASAVPGLAPLRLARGNTFSKLSVSVPDSSDLDSQGFQRVVTAGFGALADVLASDRRSAVRFWSYVPNIQETMEPGANRYMVFNIGRHDAFETWSGLSFHEKVPASSAVGVRGKTLFLHCLAADVPGRSLENPRQSPAYRYSSRYGIRPPCFARGTVIRGTDGAEYVLVSGTASILGEDTVHGDDLADQTRETLTNLATLVRSACEPSASTRSASAEWRWLDRLRSLRIHVTRRTDAAAVVEATTPHVPRLDHMEVVQADLCRPDLLVEIEGIASLTG